jgi:hypothetical protein
VHLHTLRLDRQGRRGPLPLPFVRVPQLLPAPIGLFRFREALAVQLLDVPGDGMGSGAASRPRLYPEHGHTGTERLFLPSGNGAFDIGSRSQNLLQRIDYQVIGISAAQALEIPPHHLRILSPQSPCVALLWTRELRSGDLHVCCAQIGD